MFQQQMSALQKQQQMSGPGGSSAAANAMVAMQQFSADGNNSLYAPQLPNRNTALSSNLQSGTLQQQQQQSQHLLARQQHMQQQQHHLNRSVSDTATMDNNTPFNISAKQQPGSILRNTSSVSTGMFHGMNQTPMHPPGLAMDQMQLQNNATGSGMSMLNANNFHQPGIMGGQNNVTNNNNNTSNTSSSLNNRDSLSNIDQVPMQENSTNPLPASIDGISNRMVSTDQAPFLDGRFAGGWQSNADLPERRRIIFCILDVIRQMRPDTGNLSKKYVKSIHP